MRANFDVIKEENGSMKKYSIFENRTEQVIKTFSTYDEARKSVKQLKMVGFQGWTPSFILVEVDLHK